MISVGCLKVLFLIMHLSPLSSPDVSAHVFGGSWYFPISIPCMLFTCGYSHSAMGWYGFETRDVSVLPQVHTNKSAISYLLIRFWNPRQFPYHPPVSDYRFLAFPQPSAGGKDSQARCACCRCRRRSVFSLWKLTPSGTEIFYLATFPVR